MNAKKNVLCEKPLAMNLREVQEMVAAAKLNNIFFMEVSCWDGSPQCEWVQIYVIGTVCQIMMSLSHNVPGCDEETGCAVSLQFFLTNCRLCFKAFGCSIVIFFLLIKSEARHIRTHDTSKVE